MSLEKILPLVEALPQIEKFQLIQVMMIQLENEQKMKLHLAPA